MSLWTVIIWGYSLIKHFIVWYKNDKVTNYAIKYSLGLAESLRENADKFMVLIILPSIAILRHAPFSNTPILAKKCGFKQQTCTALPPKRIKKVDMSNAV